MAISFNGSSALNAVRFNNEPLNKVVFNGTTVYNAMESYSFPNASKKMTSNTSLGFNLSIANTPASSGSSPWQSFNNNSGDSFSFGYSGARKDLTITFPPALGYVVVTKITIANSSNITYNNRDAIIYVGNEEDKVTYKTFNTNAETLNLYPSSAATDFGCNYIAFSFPNTASGVPTGVGNITITFDVNSAKLATWLNS